MTCNVYRHVPSRYMSQEVEVDALKACKKLLADGNNDIKYVMDRVAGVNSDRLLQVGQCIGAPK